MTKSNSTFSTQPAEQRRAQVNSLAVLCPLSVRPLWRGQGERSLDMLAQLRGSVITNPLSGRLHLPRRPVPIHYHETLLPDWAQKDWPLEDQGSAPLWLDLEAACVHARDLMALDVLARAYGKLELPALIRLARIFALRVWVEVGSAVEIAIARPNPLYPASPVNIRFLVAGRRLKSGGIGSPIRDYRDTSLYPLWRVQWLEECRQVLFEIARDKLADSFLQQNAALMEQRLRTEINEVLAFTGLASS